MYKEQLSKLIYTLIVYLDINFLDFRQVKLPATKKEPVTQVNLLTEG